MILIGTLHRRFTWWKFKLSDRTRFALPERSDWELLSPLLYPEISDASSTETGIYPPTEAGEYLVESRSLVLVTDRERFADREGAAPFEDTANLIGNLLLRLRHVSGQAAMTNSDIVTVVYAKNEKAAQACQA